MNTSNTFDPNRPISIIEISNSSVCVLSGVPKHINRNNQDIGRFSYDYKQEIEVAEIETENTINLDLYKDTVLPFILQAIRHIKRKQPQVFKVYLTGLHQSVNNSNQVLEFVRTIFTQKNCIGIESISTSKESYHAFTSFLETTRHGSHHLHVGSTKRPTYYFTTEGLQFYVKEDRIIASQIQGERFLNTIIIPIGIKHFKKHLLRHENLTIELLEKCNNHFKDIFLQEIIKINFEGSNYIVVSGITPLVTGMKIINNRGAKASRYRGFDLSKSRYHLEKEIINKVQKMKDTDNTFSQALLSYNVHELFVSVFRDALSNYTNDILDTFMGHYLNKSNAHIGYYYDLYNAIKKA